LLGRPFDVWSGWIWRSGTATRLGSLGGGQSWAEDINDLGQVVGYSENARGRQRAFRWVNGTMTSIGTLGGSVSRAFAINNKGHIVGHSQLTGDARDPNGTPLIHAFLKKNGVMTDLGTLGGRNSFALDINDAGQIVGWSETVAGIRHPFLWQNGAMQDLLAGSADSGTATAINPFGVVVGARNHRAFRYSGGIMRNLPLGPTARSVATGIRNGRIVGSLTTPTGPRGFVLAAGQVTLLPLFNPAGDEANEEDNGASDINAAGVIVGETTEFQSNGSPTMWTPQ
jgi:probable HAF family extracellular repeat protein